MKEELDGKMTNSKFTALNKPYLEIDIHPFTISQTNQKYRLKALHVTGERRTEAITSHIL